MNNEENHEELVRQLVEFLRPHVDGEVDVNWLVNIRTDETNQKLAKLSFTLERARYNLTIEEER